MVQLEQVRQFLRTLQKDICRVIEGEEMNDEKFLIDDWSRGPTAMGSTRVLSNGDVIEKAGVNFSDFAGPALPPSASERHPEVAGCPFHVMGVSVVVHPRNPHAPTSHMNVRYFEVYPEKGNPVWWFGGGFDLTPYYPEWEDILFWHNTAREACLPFGPEVYPLFKRQCDEYFVNTHRQETRGVGGLFYDDWSEGGFEKAFALTRNVGEAYIKAYQPILASRKTTPYNERQRHFQLYRRGRYVEFNLVHDRGTLFGLQSKGRVESILMSLPPLVRWDYQPHFEPGSREAGIADFLRPREWLAEACSLRDRSNK
jgi:coproporphyrinogen III oxidase